MLVPYRELSVAPPLVAAAAEPQAEQACEPAPAVPETKTYRMQHPDRPRGRRWTFTFVCNGVELHAVNGTVEVDARTAAALAQAGWLRKEDL